MFGFNWRKKKKEEQDSQEETHNQSAVNAATMTNASAAAGSAVQNSDLGVTRQYNRKLYDSKKAKESFHDSQFGDKKTIRGPNGEIMHRDHQAAKNKYGNKQWAAHAAEADHVDPLKNIHSRHKNDAFLSDADIKEVGNRQSNFQELSKRENSSKGAGDGSISIQKLGTEARLTGRKAKNIAKLGHAEGVQAAKETGLLVLGTAGIANMVAAVKGEKSGKEAAADTAKTGGKAAVNPLFVQCTKLLDKITEKKSRKIGDRAIAAADLTQEEMNLAAVTRALAGAVKAIIDVPMLSSDGSMNSKAETVYDDVSRNIPKYKELTAQVRSAKYSVRALPSPSIGGGLSRGIPKLRFSGHSVGAAVSTTSSAGSSMTRNIIALIIAIVAGVGSYVIAGIPLLGSCFLVTIISLLFLDRATGSVAIIKPRQIIFISLACEVCVFYWFMSGPMYDVKHHIILAAAILVISVLGASLEAAVGDNSFLGRAKEIVEKGSLCIFCLGIAFFLLILLHGLFGVSIRVSTIITEIPLIIFCLAMVMNDREDK